jgi:hypothetical protein
MLSHRKNVQTLKFWRKSKDKKRNFFYKNLPRVCKELIQVKKNSKLFHACVPLNTILDPDSNGYADQDPESG